MVFHMVIFPFAYTIHHGQTKVMVDKQGSTYYFYMHRSDNIRKIWSVDGDEHLGNRRVNNNNRDEDCLEAEAELLHLETPDINYN